ncbi:hypothetical protein PFISCL1PPCAC_5147, partial [Pristionchus fissidentatus]
PTPSTTPTSTMHPCLALVLCSFLLISVSQASAEQPSQEQLQQQPRFGARSGYYEPFMRLTSSKCSRQADKRDAGYGWHECEFSPLSC